VNHHARRRPTAITAIDRTFRVLMTCDGRFMEAIPDPGPSMSWFGGLAPWLWA